MHRLSSRVQQTVIEPTDGPELLFTISDIGFEEVCLNSLQFFEPQTFVEYTAVCGGCDSPCPGEQFRTKLSAKRSNKNHAFTF